MWAQIDGILRQAAARSPTRSRSFSRDSLVALLLILATVLIAVSRAHDAAASAARARFRVGRAHGRGDDSRMVGGRRRRGASRVSAYWTVLVLGLLISLTALDATMPRGWRCRYSNTSPTSWRR